MGCVASTDSKSFDYDNGAINEKRINDMIEKQIQAQLKKSLVQFKVLLLGTGESGKSTVFKQLKLLHLSGFGEKERIQYAQILWVDTIQLMKILIAQARKLGIPLLCDDMSNTELYQAKQKLLRVNPLKLIQADVAGGTEFLKDYMIRYTRNKSRKTRPEDSQGAQGYEIDPTVVDQDDDIRNFSKDGASEDVSNLSRELKRAHAFQTEEYSKQDIAEAIQMLWKWDLGISKAFSRRNLFQLEMNASYYFKNVDKFAIPGYRCLDQDILMGRIKTTGITELNFDIGQFKFKVLDAGGQRLERKKWINSFDGILTILFVVALSEYDQMLFEDNQVNRMHESIMLFDSLCNSRWFLNTPFILFLNKVDVLEQKLKKLPINLYFPDYKGNPTNVDEVVDFFTRIFLKLSRSRKPIYVHTTCATDTASMKFVLAAVTDVMVQEGLQESGLF